MHGLTSSLYAQLYADGKLLGGLDIVREMREEGELADAVPAAARAGGLNARLHALTHSAPVVLFMKGSRDAPRC
eukprot:6193074-Pleurochrysis_carterae.AAC.15